jgi:hypothetical protein
MISGEPEGFNPTKTEQETPYRNFGPVLGNELSGRVFSSGVTRRKMPARERVGIF